MFMIKLVSLDLQEFSSWKNNKLMKGKKNKKTLIQFSGMCQISSH